MARERGLNERVKSHLAASARHSWDPGDRVCVRRSREAVQSGAVRVHKVDLAACAACERDPLAVWGPRGCRAAEGTSRGQTAKSMEMRSVAVRDGKTVGEEREPFAIRRPGW